jgi:hypothetical protein
MKSTNRLERFNEEIHRRSPERGELSQARRAHPVGSTPGLPRTFRLVRCRRSGAAVHGEAAQHIPDARMAPDKRSPDSEH